MREVINYLLGTPLTESNEETWDNVAHRIIVGTGKYHMSQRRFALRRMREVHGIDPRTTVDCVRRYTKRWRKLNND